MDKIARVKRLEGRLAVVEVDHASGGCGRCDEPGGCRSGVLSHMFGKPCDEFSVENTIGARQGEQVVVRVDDGRLVSWSAQAYVLPVLAVFAGAVFGESAGARLGTGNAEFWSVAGALFGLVGAATLVVRRLRRNAAGGAPTLIRPSH